MKLRDNRLILIKCLNFIALPAMSFDLNPGGHVPGRVGGRSVGRGVGGGGGGGGREGVLEEVGALRLAPHHAVLAQEPLKGKLGGAEVSNQLGAN